MKSGLVALVLAYALSQFYRAFLPVLTPALGVDLGATASDLATASAAWFLIFAAMQIPVGAALDRIGPRITAVTLFAVGGAGGALVFAMAQSPFQITVAMGLIGVGCSPVLMAAYYILAKTYRPAIFATLAGAVLGLGSLGNIAGSAPMAWAAETFGWRGAMLGLAALTLAVAAALWVFITDPERDDVAHRGSVLDLLKMPILWPIFAMMLVGYAPAAALRGLWAGPYAADVFGATATTIGTVTFIMGMAMIAGNFLLGAADRVFGTRKWVIFGAIATGIVALFILAAIPAQNIWLSAVLLAVVGFTGSTFPVLIAHGKAFFPAHLTGRGVTLLNLFGIGGAGLAQMASGPFHASMTASSGIIGGYSWLFAAFGIAALIGAVIYLRATDRTD